MRKQRHRVYRDCPIEAALDLIGGKWKATILYSLSQRIHRFGELLKAYPKITQRTLTRQLREMEADALIERTVFAEVPPRVEYRLSTKGVSLIPVLEALFDWGSDNAIDANGCAISAAAQDNRERREPIGDEDEDVGDTP